MPDDTVGRPMEILLIEDELFWGRVTSMALDRGDFPHRLTWLTSGEEGLEFVRCEGKYVMAPRPDLILLDLGLPGLDGREVLLQLKSEDELSTIPVVIVTASEDESDRTAAEGLNVDGFVTKPVDWPRFVRLVQDLHDFWRSDILLPNGS